MSTSSELILNNRGAVYHLDLLPEEIADTIFIVGDPHRVSHVSKFFDEIILERNHREFITHTGSLNGKKITAISTGMGPDNIEIFMNELDALVNVDLKIGQVKEVKKSLNIIRLGTSGAIQKDININSVLLSKAGVGFDSLANFYPFLKNDSLLKQLNEVGFAGESYMELCSEKLFNHFQPISEYSGVTLTMPGFYAPQQRSIRLQPLSKVDFDALQDITWQNQYITNFEMETATIYGFARLLGHEALSINTILANRIQQRFSEEVDTAIDRMIELAVRKVSSLL